ncbi:MAG TPA: class I SAM-dependent methyltransferase [Candidatus Cryosericum sp.]
MTEGAWLQFFSGDVPYGDATCFAPWVQSPAFTGALLNGLVDPRKWLDPSWRDIARSLAVVRTDMRGMHRKAYEWTQAAYGLRCLGALRRGSRSLGVGAGHEALVYWLAANGSSVVATDLYEGEWVKGGAHEGDAQVISHPYRYAPFALPPVALEFRRMDGRSLAFEGASFDVVFSLSSIEHFGTKSDASTAMSEIGRVLRPGGYAVIATECVLNGAPHPAYFSPEELAHYVVSPSGLELVQPVSLLAPRAFLDSPVRVPEDTLQTPHLSLTDGTSIWTSVLLFMVKPAS